MIKVLVATKDLILERMLTVTLTINGFSVVTTKSLREAHSIMANGKITILLMDQDMEKENNLTFLQGLKEENLRVPVLILGEGVKGWASIKKPFDFPTLKTSMNKLLRRRLFQILEMGKMYLNSPYWMK